MYFEGAGNRYKILNLALLNVRNENVVRSTAMYDKMDCKGTGQGGRL